MPSPRTCRALATARGSCRGGGATTAGASPSTGTAAWLRSPSGRHTQAFYGLTCAMATTPASASWTRRRGGLAGPAPDLGPPSPAGDNAVAHHPGYGFTFWTNGGLYHVQRDHHAESWPRGRAGGDIRLRPA